MNTPSEITIYNCKTAAHQIADAFARHQPAQVHVPKDVGPANEAYCTVSLSIQDPIAKVQFAWPGGTTTWNNFDIKHAADLVRDQVADSLIRGVAKPPERAPTPA